MHEALLWDDLSMFIDCELVSEAYQGKDSPRQFIGGMGWKRELPHVVDFIFKHLNYCIHRPTGRHMIPMLEHHMQILQPVGLRQWCHGRALSAICQVLANPGPQGMVLAKGGKHGHRTELEPRVRLEKG